MIKLQWPPEQCMNEIYKTDKMKIEGEQEQDKYQLKWQKLPKFHVTKFEHSVSQSSLDSEILFCNINSDSEIVVRD